jgi:hypothetical protein
MKKHIIFASLLFTVTANKCMEEDHNTKFTFEPVVGNQRHGWELSSVQHQQEAQNLYKEISQLQSSLPKKSDCYKKLIAKSHFGKREQELIENQKSSQ